jgi:hypothetical protein
MDWLYQSDTETLNNEVILLVCVAMTEAYSNIKIKEKNYKNFKYLDTSSLKQR